VQQTHANAFCYLNLNGADVAGMPVAAMQNKAGNVVYPTTDSVTSSMNDFRYVLDEGSLAYDLGNGEGEDSWPMSFVVSVAIYKNITRSDCSYISELLQFIAWTQVNDEVSTASADIQYVPLTFGYKKRVTDLISTYPIYWRSR
jgi:ABC-type phosphate transport system substrate-binding protein